MTYTKEHKTCALDVPASLLRDKGAVCGDVPRAMAEGALQHSTAGISAAITGVAGPEPDEVASAGVFFGSAPLAGRAPRRGLATLRGRGFGFAVEGFSERRQIIVGAFHRESPISRRAARLTDSHGGFE